MFGKIGDMMGRLQEMKRKADEIKNRLDTMVVSAEGAGGDIKIEITGNRHIKSLIISEALQHGDRSELQKQLVLTVNKAIAEANKINDAEMKEAASGLLPGM